MAWSICGIRLCRSFTACGNGNFKPCGHSDSDVFHKIKIDPAVASGPLITTVNDLMAVVTYYGLAFLFLIEL